MDIQEILVIKNGSQSYGISTNCISQIARVPMLMPLPLRPYGVRGLCAVSGNITSMVDMNLLLSLTEVDYEDEKTRLIVLNGALASSTLLVSEVFITVEIDEKKLESTDEIDNPIIAIYKHESDLIQILSLEVLFSKISKVEIEAKEVRNGKVKLETKKEEDTSRFLIFSMENERYALNIEYLREIILADVEFTSIAGTSAEVLGLITLRDELLIVIDLRKHYGFSTKESDKNRILIASYDGKKIGLLVDGIIDIKSFINKDIEYMRDSFKDNKISGVIHENDNIISFFDSDVLENLFEENKTFIDEEKVNLEEDNSHSTIMEVIVFKLSSKEYSFDIASVSEIIDIVPSTRVALADSLIDGIINIRGQIVAIISLFEKLNIPRIVNEDSKIIICEISGIKIGFIVDSVSDILNITQNQIKEQDDAFFSKVLHLDNGKRLVLSMDIDKIVSKEII
ncbi:MAG: purine-binding chemotaxis protein CheW [Sulfurimonas sp.]|jgi:purine-binding chemotaxis protein CheW|uniref:chemotaxis protein CheW n=1 Tax=Sulfurimonas sp. TaxID=2022749 RepID=UPI0039E6EDED